MAASTDKSDLPSIVIVGRPNVGKSCLFNRLVGHKSALVHDAPGVTRDLRRDRIESTGREGTLVDTGGLWGDTFASEIQAQAERALSTASAVLLVIDARMGPTPADQEISRWLRKSTKAPVALVANKVDPGSKVDISEAYELGHSEVIPVSAEHGEGMSDLLIWLAPYLRPIVGPLETTPDPLLEPSEDAVAPKPLRVTLLGRPNAGKSTLLNSLLGEPRAIVSPIAGTTTDCILEDWDLPGLGQPVQILDTAGIRRRNKTQQGIEVLSVTATLRALRHSDAAVLLIDGTVGVHDQDEKVAGLAEEAGTSVVLAVNKADLLTQVQQEELKEDLRRKLGFLRHAPIVTLSGETGYGLDSLRKTLTRVLQDRTRWIDTHELTECVRRENQVHNPKGVKFFFAHQTARHPPAFVFYVNHPDRVVESLRRHLINSIRRQWGFAGTPIRAVYRRTGRQWASNPTK